MTENASVTIRATKEQLSERFWLDAVQHAKQYGISLEEVKVLVRIVYGVTPWEAFDAVYPTEKLTVTQKKLAVQQLMARKGVQEYTEWVIEYGEKIFDYTPFRNPWDWTFKDSVTHLKYMVAVTTEAIDRTGVISVKEAGNLMLSAIRELNKMYQYDGRITLLDSAKEQLLRAENVLPVPGTYRIDPLLYIETFEAVHRAVLREQVTEVILKGGRGSTKSTFASLMIIEWLLNHPQHHALVLRQVADTLRGSVYSQLNRAIAMLGLEDKFDSHVSPMEITLKSTGQTIYFRGADDPLKIKSITTPFGSIGILWFEELDQFKGPNAIRSIEQSALRGGDAGLEIKSFNPPPTASNWANKEALVPKEGRIVHHSTFKDVPVEWLGALFMENAEHLKQVNPKAYEHELEGIPNSTGGMIFENVQPRQLTDEEIAGFDYVYMGVDWGWYPDPYHWVKLSYHSPTDTIYIFDEYRCYKQSNKQTAEYLVAHKGITAGDLLVCDAQNSDGNKSTADYRAFGLTAREAEKGPGSVAASMKWLQSRAAIVIDHVRCPETYKEFSEYEYERTKDGDIISGYPDVANHGIDAVRYALERVWKRRGN